MSNVTPFLWFNGKAEEAMNFYVSIFKNSKVVKVARFGKKGDAPGGEVTVATFELDGQEFCALNGGPEFSFSPAISFYVKCETQKEVDDLWEGLSAEGESLGCGWIKDKYGVTWQIIPNILPEMLQDKDGEKSERVRKAMLQMQKIDIGRLEQAYRQA